jgi:hypothetical protein
MPVLSRIWSTLGSCEGRAIPLVSAPHLQALLVVEIGAVAAGPQTG